MLFKFVKISVFIEETNGHAKARPYTGNIITSVGSKYDQSGDYDVGVITLEIK